MTTLADLTNDMVTEIEEALKFHHDPNDYEAQRESIINSFLVDVKERLLGIGGNL